MYKRQILAREAAKDSQSLSVVVFDNQGRTLYQHRDSSPTNHPLTELSPDQSGAILHDSPTSVWRADDPETLIVGTPLINNFGRAVGGITLRYDRAFYDRELEQALIGLTRTAVLILIGASPVSYTHLDVYKRQVFVARLATLCLKVAW